MNIKIFGKIKTIFPEETIGNFKKKVLWVEEQEVQWPNTYEVQFVQGKTVELDGYKEGELVEIDADVRGRHSAKNGKEYVFNSISGWRIQRIGKQTLGKQEVPGNSVATPASPPSLSGVGDTTPDDDLPF